MKLVSLGRPREPLTPTPPGYPSRGDASRGPGGELSLNPSLRYLELPGLSRAAGSQAYTSRAPASQERRLSRPWESAEGTKTLHRPGSGGLGQRGQRQAMGWGVSANASNHWLAIRITSPRAALGPSLGARQLATTVWGVHSLIHIE